MLDLRAQRRGGDVLFRIASQRRPGRSGLRSPKHHLAVLAAARHRRAGARMVVAAPQGGSNGPPLGARPTSAVRGRFGAAAMVKTAVAAAALSFYLAKLKFPAWSFGKAMVATSGRSASGLRRRAASCRRSHQSAGYPAAPTTTPRYRSGHPGGYHNPGWKNAERSGGGRRCLHRLRGQPLDNTMIALDTRTGAQTVIRPGGMHAVTVDPARHTVVASNTAAGTVSVIERSTARAAVLRALDGGRPALVFLRDGSCGLTVGRPPDGVAGRGRRWSERPRTGRRVRRCCAHRPGAGRPDVLPAGG